LKIANKLHSTLRAFILLLILTWTGLPILLITLSAFKDPRTIFESPPKLLFRPTLQNFIDLFTDWPQFFSSLLNSALITIIAAFIVLSVTFIAGYVFSRYKSGYFILNAFLMLALRMLPPIVASIPLFPIIHELNLQDNHFTLGLIYATFFVSLGSWIMKTFIDNIPREMEESAAIDGASIGQILRHIMIPLSGQGMVTVSIFVIIYAWKEYLWASIFTSSNAVTAPIILSQMLDATIGAQWGPVFAATLLQYLPLLIFILYVQKFLVRGLMIGAVKE
jgi:multiple sugar transport system permease protein